MSPSARLGEKQLGCEAERYLSCPGQRMEISCHEPMQLCRLVATAEPSHVLVHVPRPQQLPLALRKGHQGHRRQARAGFWDSDTAQGLPGWTNAPQAANACSARPVPPGRCPLAPLSPGTAVPRLRSPLALCPAAAASHLLGIADPEGDGVEMDEAASLGLKGRENGAESCCCYCISCSTARLQSRGKQQLGP